MLHGLASVMREEVDRQQSDTGKADCLGRWLKRVSQEPENPSLAFHLYNERVSEFISKWIRAEIFHCDGSCRFSQTVHDPSGFSGFVNDEMKLEVNLSVAQIACLLRTFAECGIIQNNSPRDLSVFTAGHFRSKKQTHISPESLRVKYYNIEESTREEVSRLIHQLQETIDTFT